MRRAGGVPRRGAAMTGYAHPEVLVETGWLAEHQHDRGLRIVEVDVDTTAYGQAHIPGAVGWNWTTQLCDPLRRDILGRSAFEALMARSGIANDTTVILYGDSSNWFAAWALWQMKLYGHEDVRLMNGGRRKWLAEGRELTTEEPQIAVARYTAAEPDLSLRVMLPEAMAAVGACSAAFVDVRTPDEYSGRILAPPGVPEGCQRGGHIPGAASIPWSQTCNDDGTFKPHEQLKALYAAKGVTGERPVITYCRIGERSSHSWFVLRYLLGFADVRNYDGSWTEWGNLVGAPVEKGG
jgi:thiosulfate/3-mercaptopyruvate sulfurtransferase